MLGIENQQSLQRCKAEQSGVSRRHSAEVIKDTSGRAERKGGFEIWKTYEQCEESRQIHERMELPT
jgi:hypothetical protein